MFTPEAVLRQMFEAAITSAQPASCLPLLFPQEPETGRLVVLGAGKASAAMARAAEEHYGRPLEGVVVTRYGHAVPCDGIEILEAAHPVPDAASRMAAKRILAFANSLTADDTVLCLISGGGSSLLALPAKGVKPEETREINRALTKAGATINEMNCVRRHISAVKGGRLAVACHPARVHTLIISDVPGNDPASVASGPTEPDKTTCADALKIVDRYGVVLPGHIRSALENDAYESVKPDDPRLAGNQTRFAASPQFALEAAARVARAAGYDAHILGAAIEGEAREVGTVMAGITCQVSSHTQPFEPPCVLLSGGETTVTGHGSGHSGRNAEFLLSLAIALDGHDGVYAIAGDTDGIDGGKDVAGAVIGPETLARGRAHGMSCREFLDNGDAHAFFETIGAQVITGPTLTNVNDFRAILIE